MNHTSIEMLVDKWMNEQLFRDKVKQNPEGALNELSIVLTAEDREALRQIDWNLPDEELQTRISKGG